MIVSQRKRIYVNSQGKTEKIDMLQSMRKLEVPGSNIFALCCQNDKKEVEKSIQKPQENRWTLFVAIFVILAVLVCGSLTNKKLSLYQAPSQESKSSKNIVQDFKDYLQKKQVQQNSNSFFSFKDFIQESNLSAQNSQTQIAQNLSCKIIGGDIFCKISHKKRQ